MSHSYIVSAKRSAVAPRAGAFSALSIHELAAPVISACLDQASIQTQRVDEIIVGNALGGGGNPARLIALASGLAETVAGLSIDRQCCSGLDAIGLADSMIRAGQADVVLAGGSESYSLRPKRFRVSPDLAEPQAYEQPPFTPWPERDPDMAEAADALARKLGISGAEQNAWAINSHRKALLAQAQLREEIAPMNNVTHDTFARHLSPAICDRAKKIAGNISLANTAVAADGAAFCLLVSEKIAKQLDTHCLRIVGHDTLGANPDYPGSAPVTAIRQTLGKSGIGPADIDCIEIMEAYAAQAIACTKLSHIDPARVNTSGGALSRGHPIGASGAILAVRLFHELKTRHKGYGLAAIAAAGGLGTALLVQTAR